MRLYVMRHCFAGSPLLDPKAERERPLTAEGRATAAAIANAMGELGEMPKSIFCSSFARATQTADIVGKILGVQVNIIGEMAPIRPLQAALNDIVSAPEKIKRVLLVGHVDNTTPAMNQVGGDVTWKDLVMGEVRRVKIKRQALTWQLKWALKPSDLGLKDRKS